MHSVQAQGTILVGCRDGVGVPVMPARIGALTEGLDRMHGSGPERAGMKGLPPQDGRRLARSLGRCGEIGQDMHPG